MKGQGARRRTLYPATGYNPEPDKGKEAGRRQNDSRYVHFVHVMRRRMKYVTSLEEEERRRVIGSRVCVFYFRTSTLSLVDIPASQAILNDCKLHICPEESHILDTTAPTTLPLLATSVASVILADWSLSCQSEISAHPIGCGN